MKVYSSETLRAVAFQRYAECEAIIIEMSNIIKTVRPDFSTDVALGQYDVILQACMLSSAMQDGGLLAQEKGLIVDIARHTDILPLINDALKLREPFDWDGLDELDEYTKNELLDTAYRVARDYADEFVDFFAVVDKVISEKSYYDLIFKETGALLAVLAGIDEDDMEGEQALIETKKGLITFIRLVKNRWNEILNG